MMEWEEIEEARRKALEQRLRASRDLDFARAQAAAAYERTVQVAVSAKKNGAELSTLLDALKGLSPSSIAYLQSIGAALDTKIKWKDVVDVTYEAVDLIEKPGRKPSLLGDAVCWLSYWWIGQGNRVGNVLRDSKSSETGTKPSPMLKFLHKEMVEIDAEIPIETVHSTRRRDDVAKALKDFAEVLRSLQK